MPIIFEKDISKYYDKEELKLAKRGSGLFPAGYSPRKERSGDGFLDVIAQGAKIFKLIKENKENIKGVAEAVGSVVAAGRQIKDEVVNNNNNNNNSTAATTKATTATLANIKALTPLAPAAETIDPNVYKNLRDSVKEGTGLMFNKKNTSKNGMGFKYD